MLGTALYLYLHKHPTHTGWRNFFENTAAVQFDHRVLAVSTLVAVASLWAYGVGLPLPARSKTLLHALLGMATVQVSLGVATLLTYVPVSLGSAHQGGALALFSIALGLVHSLRAVPHVSPVGAAVQFLTPAALAATAAVLGSGGGGSV